MLFCLLHFLAYRLIGNECARHSVRDMTRRKLSSNIPWQISLSAFLLVFAMWSPRFCVPPMGNIIREQLLISHAQLSILYSAPIIMVAALALPGGLLADRIGVKKAAGIGVILIAVGTALRGIAHSPSTLLAFTFIYGAGFGLSYPNIPKLVSAWAPPEKTGATTGLFNLGLPIGSALVLALTMQVVYPASNTFQGVFLIWSIPPIVAAISWWALVREGPTSMDSQQKHNKVHFMTTLDRVFRNRNLWLLLSLLFLNEFFMSTMMGWSPALLIMKGATPQMAGIITSIISWAAVPAVLLMPRLCDRVGLRRPFLWVPSIVLAVVALVTINANLSMTWLIMAVIGVAVPTRFITILTLIVELIPDKDVGTASGLVFIGYIGGVIGPYIAGLSLDISGALNSTLMVLVGVSIATAGITLRLPETGHRFRDWGVVKTR